MSQCRAIAAHLKKGRTLTALEALRLFGCGRTAARIDELRKLGMEITTTMISVEGKHGKARIARYSLMSAKVPGAASHG